MDTSNSSYTPPKILGYTTMRILVLREAGTIHPYVFYGKPVSRHEAADHLRRSIEDVVVTGRPFNNHPKIVNEFRRALAAWRRIMVEMENMPEAHAVSLEFFLFMVAVFPVYGTTEEDFDLAAWFWVREYQDYLHARDGIRYQVMSFDEMLESKFRESAGLS